MIKYSSSDTTCFI